ncbi:hypothetical protein [Desulfosoma sp.]|uniref:hypothetical protein n=1 Tax=Desulfosoma sp. TaxID=2603217 RepID=UPI00404998FF
MGAKLLAHAVADLAAEVFLLKGAARIHVEGRVEGERHIACPTATASGQKVCLVLTAPDLRLSPLELDRIFEPYAFRHLAVGKGLGGSTAYLVVRRRGGHLAAVRDDGAETQLIVCLPAGTFQKSSGVDRGGPTKERGAFTARLLIMDDEHIVRETLREILQLKGFEVTLAADGHEATALDQAALVEGKPFDAVI